MTTAVIPTQEQIPEFHKALTSNENSVTNDQDNVLKIHNLMKRIAGGASPFSMDG